MRIVRAIVAVAVAVVAIMTVLGAGAASAHVTVQPPTATKDDFAALAFQVPTESETASTTQVKVTFPADHPLPSVSVQPKDGWTYEVTKRTLPQPITVEGAQVSEVVDSVTWKGGQIKPGEFDRFLVSVGPLPDDADSLSFATEQTYSDGSVVQWNEPQQAGTPEPEHPTPTLTLTAASGAPSSSSGGSSSDSTARALGVV